MANKELDWKYKRQTQHLEEWKETPQFSDSGENRDIKYVESEIERFTKSLSLDNQTRDFAFQIYKSAKNANIVRGHRIDDIVGAAIYMSCREQDVPYVIEDISEKSSSNKDSIGKTYRYLAKELGLGFEPKNPKSFIDKYVRDVNSIRVSENNEVLGDDVNNRSKEILDLAEEKKLISGKSPSGLAAASIYLAAKQLGYKKVRQVDLVNIADVSELTVRERYKEQQKAWNEYHS